MGTKKTIKGIRLPGRFKNRKHAWSLAKKQWCCKHENLACSGDATPIPRPSPTPPPTASPRLCDFDCSQGESNWRQSWSIHKKMCCCKQVGIGCILGTTTTTTAQFDCSADFDTWERAWSAEKKGWCCTHQDVACPRSYDCFVALLHGWNDTVVPYSETKKYISLYNED